MEDGEELCKNTSVATGVQTWTRLAKHEELQGVHVPCDVWTWSVLSIDVNLDMDETFWTCPQT